MANFAASVPVEVAHVLVAQGGAGDAASGFTSRDLLEGTLPAPFVDAAIHRGRMRTDSGAALVSVGLCGMSATGTYSLYLAAQSLAVAEAYSEVYTVDFDMAAICGKTEPFVCEPGTFLQHLQPFLRVTSGPALTVADRVALTTPQGLRISQV